MTKSLWPKQNNWVYRLNTHWVLPSLERDSWLIPPFNRLRPAMMLIKTNDFNWWIFGFSPKVNLFLLFAAFYFLNLVCLVDLVESWSSKGTPCVSLPFYCRTDSLVSPINFVWEVASRRRAYANLLQRSCEKSINHRHLIFSFQWLRFPCTLSLALLALHCKPLP